MERQEKLGSKFETPLLNRSQLSLCLTEVVLSESSRSSLLVVICVLCLQVGFFPYDCVEVIGSKDKNRLSSSNAAKETNSPSQGKATYGENHDLYSRLVCDWSTLVVEMSHTSKIRAFLRAFMRHRPTRMDLKKSGIVMERVFGSDLGEYLVNSALLGESVITFSSVRRILSVSSLS